jgi:hypothetical protein
LHSQALQDALTAHPALLDWPAPAAEGNATFTPWEALGGRDPNVFPLYPYIPFITSTRWAYEHVTIVDREARAEQLGRSVAGHLMDRLVAQQRMGGCGWDIWASSMGMGMVE